VKTLLAVLLGVGVLMATFSMFGSNTRITVTGDEMGAKAYLGEANKRLHQLRSLSKPGGVYALPPVKYSDGTVLTARTAAGFDYITIHKPTTGGKVGKFELTKWYTNFCGYNQGANSYDWKVNKTDTEGVIEWEKFIAADGSFYSAYKIAVDEKADVFTVGKSFKYSDDLGYYDEFNWVVEKRDKKGEQKWIIENNVGGAIDVTVDKSGLYIVGRGYGGVYNGSFVRVEKRDKSDGSLIWQQDYEKVGTYDRAVACAVAKDFLYVSAYALWGSSPQYQQGRLLTVNKVTGAIVGIYEDTQYESPFPRSSMFEIAVSVKDVEGSGTSNVVMMTDRWIRVLNPDISGPSYLSADVVYGAVADDFLTIDKGIAADKDGVYTVGQLPATGSYDYHGYEIKKFNKNGMEQWSTIYADGAGYNIGPFLSDIAVDDKYIYISGFKKESTGGRKSIRQALDKKTGKIAWTNIDAPSTYNYMWGVGTYFTKMSIETKE